MKKWLSILIVFLIVSLLCFCYLYFFHLNSDERFIMNAVLKENESYIVVKVLNAKKCYKEFGKINLQYETSNGGLVSILKYIYGENMYEETDAPSDNNIKRIRGIDGIWRDVKAQTEEEKEAQWNIYNLEQTINDTCAQDPINISKNGINKINRVIRFKVVSNNFIF